GGGGGSRLGPGTPAQRVVDGLDEQGNVDLRTVGHAVRTRRERRAAERDADQGHQGPDAVGPGSLAIADARERGRFHDLIVRGGYRDGEDQRNGLKESLHAARLRESRRQIFVGSITVPAGRAAGRYRAVAWLRSAAWPVGTSPWLVPRGQCA